MRVSASGSGVCRPGVHSAAVCLPVTRHIPHAGFSQKIRRSCERAVVMPPLTLLMRSCRLRLLQRRQAATWLRKTKNLLRTFWSVKRGLVSVPIWGVLGSVVFVEFFFVFAGACENNSGWHTVMQWRCCRCLRWWWQ